MATFNHISGQEPSTVSFKVATITQTRNSSVMHQEILSIGDPDSSAAIAAVVNQAPGSTAWALAVREVTPTSIVTIAALPPTLLSTSVSAANSTAFHVRVVGGASSAADFPVAISGNSTAIQGTNPWTIAGNSTVVQGTSPWTIAGTSTVVVASGNSSVIVTSGNSSVIVTSGNSSVTISAVAAGAGRLNIGSTAADNAVLISGNSTVVVASGNSSVIITSGNSSVTITAIAAGAGRINIGSTAADNAVALADGAGNALESSTSAPSTGARGLLVRPILGGSTTYSASTTGQSTATVLVSSAAASRAFVYAYSITSTLAGPVTWAIYSGANSGGTRLWGGVLAAVSSAISGVNLAVSPPAYLFANSTGNALTFVTATSNAGLDVSMAYWVST